MLDAAHIGKGGRVERDAAADGLAFEEAEQAFLREGFGALRRGLRDLQAERIRNYKRDQAEEILLARYSDIKGLPYQAPSTPTLNGSVFSNPEVFAATNRLTTLRVAKNELWKHPVKVQYAGAASGAPSNVVNWPQPDAA